jgi:hypothetical protein
MRCPNDLRRLFSSVDELTFAGPSLGGIGEKIDVRLITGAHETGSARRARQMSAFPR